jgi:hypothetical protein
MIASTAAGKGKLTESRLVLILVQYSYCMKVVIAVDRSSQ